MYTYTEGMLRMLRLAIITVMLDSVIQFNKAK